MNELAKYSDALERQKRVRCFIDGIDWQHHLGQDPKGTVLYPTAEDTIKGNACLREGSECGVVEVEVRLIRWAVKQDLPGEMARNEPSPSDKHSE